MRKLDALLFSSLLLSSLIVLPACGDDGNTGGTAGSGGTGATGGMGGTGGAGGGMGGAGGMGGGMMAHANIEPQSGSGVSGTAMFTMANGMVTLTVNIEGATPGEHAVHIHDMPDCSMNGDAAMGHWNPTNAMHGKWGGNAFHLGDIGNITVDASGKGTLTLTTNLWTVGDGAMGTDVTKHAFMVHADPDDFMTQPTGNAGARIGCGVITMQ
ncbi:superoxide dismutase family protein [Polyangium aurulentum]|uniref:superoxide dismutase family protein n=1 Tax=Polyangium aurulentum TaxID=2567896 RepID=UPI00197E2229|nr:superoxide dismutase family protein [Polyangium aurulentum]UQA55413.1 superoxide dismutase family protein [Polyangium aurulentum]